MPELLTKEEYLKAYDYMNPPRETFGRATFKDNFDIKAMVVINDIEEHAKEFNNAKWAFIANEFKDNHDVMLAALKSGCVPTDIVHSILENTKMVKENITTYYNISQEDIRIVASAMYNDISQSDLETIYKYLGKQMISMHGFNTSYSKECNDRINPNAMNFMAITLAKNYDPPVRAYYHDSDGLAVITFVKDENVIKEICNLPDVHEDVRAMCINNPYISDELRDEIFQIGCNVELLTKFTPSILDEVYRSAIESLESGFEATEKELRSAHFMSKSFLYDLVTKHVLTEAMEIDLANIVLSQADTSMDNLRHQIFYCTKSPKVLELAEKIKGKDKLTAYENEYMPETMLRARTDKMLKTIKKNIETNNRRKTPDVWFEYLRKYVHRLELSSADYEMLLNENDSHLIVAIATSPKTPKDVLESIIQKQEVNRYISPRVAVAARMNIECKELPDNIKEHMMKFCKEIHPHSYELEKYMENISLAEKNNNIRTSNLTYATQSLEAIVREADDDILKKVFDIIETNRGKEPNPKAVIEYDYMTHILEKEQTKKQQKNQFKETGSIEGFDEAMLRTILQNMTRHDWNFTNISNYVSLYHNAKDAIRVGEKWQELKEERERLEAIEKGEEATK